MTEVLTESPRMSSKMAKRYKDAWDYLFSELTEWSQREIIKNPNGKYADTLAHEASKLAEREKDVIPSPQPKRIK